MARVLLNTILVGLLLSTGSGPSLGSDGLLFESEIAPLLISHCLECHQGPAPAGGLDLTTSSGFRSGGDSGEAFDPTSPRDSLLLLHVSDGHMPPPLKGKPQKLSDSEVASLIRWFDSGANWPTQRTLDWFERTTTKRAGRDWWSLQPIREITPPESQSNVDIVHPIDAFIRSGLQKAGMTPSPLADPSTRIRRLYFDMLGLPPDDHIVTDFLEDTSPQAWQRLVDQVLASPHYGQRWGRYWLDLARYAETSGYERDQEKPFAWKYRDWVIQALNDDMPFAQFITSQLAGDQLPNRTEADVIATGFLRLGTWNDEPNDPQDYLYERLEDLVHTTSSAFLGLTMKCARCHAHKFDPIEQMDYYRMAAAFWPGPIRPRSSEHLGGPSNEELGFDSVLGWTDLSESPAPLRVLKNGERHQPLSQAIAGSFSFLPQTYCDFVSHRDSTKSDGAVLSAPTNSSKQGTGYRLQLAQWIAHPDNPLTYRVMVNRIWQHHFGNGLVRTPNNFGFLADPPTHPELLDWLARELIRSGGSLKSLHRLILTSATYQQSADHPRHEHYIQLDASNRYLWHAERRRLDSETLRDSMLVASGELDRRFNGPGFVPSVQAEALEGLSQKANSWKASSDEEQSRRAIYRYSKRALIDPLANVFDFCDTTQPCGQREESTVPTQSLALLNNPWAHARSRRLASRILARTPDPKSQIDLAWKHVLRRSPTESEMHTALGFIRAQADAHKTREMELAQVPSASNLSHQSSVSAELRFWISADAPHERSESGTVRSIPDQSGQGNALRQDDPRARPTFRTRAIGQRSAFHFSGSGQYLHFTRAPFTEPQFTILAVVTDEASSGHREIISNWNATGNVGTSIFLGLTQENQIRLTDAFSDAGRIPDRRSPFILIATHGPGGTSVYCNGRLLGSLAHGLANRRIDTPWVVGQQGNIQGEYWHGLLADLRIYDAPLSDPERQAIELELSNYYGIPVHQESRILVEPLTPDLVGLASLCHVLINSNEFLYVD